MKKKIYRFAVTGGRDFTDESLVRRALADIPPTATMINGAAPGADSLAEKVWREMGGRVELFPANWNLHGKSAGPMRNQEMANASIGMLLVFPGGRGTADMVARCRKDCKIEIVFADESHPDAAVS